MSNRKKIKGQYRQGDVLIEEIPRSKKLPAAKPVEAENGRLIIARGEVTGHSHSVSQEGASLLDCEDSTLLLDVESKTGVEVEHQEHRAIPLRPERHRIVRQTEWWNEEARSVQD